MKLALEDLKAYYFEAMAAQPGQMTATGTTLANWFWRDTAAGKGLFALKDRWKDSEDRSMRLISRLFLVPSDNVADSPYLKTSA